MNTKYTARIRQTKAAIWFQWKVWPLNTSIVKSENMVRETTSWITLSWTRLKGPPLSTKPMRLAGTWKEYSKRAMPHEKPDQGPVVDELHLLQLEVSVPCESHEYVGHHQQQDSIESGHIGNLISERSVHKLNLRGIAVLGCRTLGRITESDAVEQFIALGEAQTFQIISGLG